MNNEAQMPKSSIFLNLVYWGRKLQAGFIAFVLVLATFFIYQYWQDLSQAPLILVAKVQTNVAVFTLNMPESLTSHSDGIASDIKLITNSLGKEVSDSDNVIIEFSSDNPNVNFEPKQIILPKLELEKDENSYIVKVTSASTLDGEKIVININIINSDETQVSFQKIIPVDNKIKNPYVIIAALLSFLSAVLSFIMQIVNFRSK